MKSTGRKEKYDIAIIGAGPAGMMAAVRASECGAGVVLLEKRHKPGIKLLMTGKERCNITNAEKDARRFADNFGKNGKFLLSALHRFGVEDTINFFHKHYVRTKTERGGRIFPESDRSSDVQGLFLRLIKKYNISMLTGCKINKINNVGRSIESLALEDRDIRADSYIISTGGLSYPETGSTGDGYNWAEEMGHTVIEPEPSLTPIEVKESWIKELEGLSLKNVLISVYQDKKKRDERFGEALFTGRGMSGPVILDMSKSIGKLLGKGQVDLLIDFKPALDFIMLDKRLLRDLEKGKNMSIRNLLSGLIPKTLIPVILKLAKIDPSKKGNSISKDERKRLKLLLKEFPLAVKGLHGFDKAIITAGGISLREIDPKTMRSRIIKNLYFAGEILDLDGPTGGFNLQVCWSTGYIAGESAAKEAGRRPPTFPLCSS